jgi:hypothetical protein
MGLTLHRLQVILENRLSDSRRGRPHAPSVLSCARCGDPAELRETVYGRDHLNWLLPIYDFISPSLSDRFIWKYICQSGHEETLRDARRRLKF